VRRLIIDTATRACSVALFEGDSCIASFHEEIGRGHAERLVPMIAELPEKGRAEAIHVNVGPGSFTGIRVGVSAARALALAWSAECHGYGCLDLVAAMARGQSASAVDVVMTGGHGEYYFQSFAGDGRAISGARSLPPEKAAELSHADIAAGDMAEAVVQRRRNGLALAIIPDAREWLRIATQPPLSPSPAYVRGPDAKLPGGVMP
jgi:tRNA threonylcarbamoyladenosine biosynthesis protein TsaB